MGGRVVCPPASSSAAADALLLAPKLGQVGVGCLAVGTADVRQPPMGCRAGDAMTTPVSAALLPTVGVAV